MRRFSSYGPLDKELHYYAPRTALIDMACRELLGDDPTRTGHYLTVWAPRQTGKTWLMQEVLYRLRSEQAHFDVVKLNLQDLEDRDVSGVYQGLIFKLERELERPFPKPTNQLEFAECFSKLVLAKPLILILDEFDTLAEAAIHGVVSALRNIYIHRLQQNDKATADKYYLLHSVALMGVRSVLGVDNSSGSPFNVQRSIHIPNLTLDEVAGLFHWYSQERGQTIEPAVIDRIYYETQGQPGLTCWLGELLTERYNRHAERITSDDFTTCYTAALNSLPNNNILNIIAKARHGENKALVLELFKTDSKIPFRFDDPRISFLYMNGVITPEIAEDEHRYVKFASPLIQKRLFNHFAYELFQGSPVLYDPFDDLADTISETHLHVPMLLQRYQRYLRANRQRLFADVPRRKTDDRIYEAIYHFSLYMFLNQFLASYEGRVIPEFPTGNGKIDLFIQYAGAVYGLEVKSFLNLRQYQDALVQAAHYGQQLGLSEMWLVFFVETVNDEQRKQYQADFRDVAHGVTVHPILVATGG